MTLGDVETFIPVTPTVYIRVEAGAARMSELHSKLNTEALAFKEEWPYIPHLTIVKMTAEPPAQTAFQIARERWARYAGGRRILVERLTFVREDARITGSIWPPFLSAALWFPANSPVIWHSVTPRSVTPVARAWP